MRTTRNLLAATKCDGQVMFSQNIEATRPDSICQLPSTIGPAQTGGKASVTQPCWPPQRQKAVTQCDQSGRYLKQHANWPSINPNDQQASLKHLDREGQFSLQDSVRCRMNIPQQACRLSTSWPDIGPLQKSFAHSVSVKEAWGYGQAEP